MNAACAAVFRAKFDLSWPGLRSAYLDVLGIFGGLVICLWAATLARLLSPETISHY